MPTLTIDGVAYPAEPQKNLLQVSLSHGLDLPYFCWHPALGSVGACRQCAVRQYRDENDSRGQIVMACMVPATPGTRIAIEDEEARLFRKSVIEWLMTNHPHDCPVCDEGGECHLQDMTVMTGHCTRRHRFPKRTFTNQYLGPFINHEMNRCIQCYRCVRFYRDYAGGRDLDAFASRNHVYFGRSEDGALENEFSGNLIEVCPTGVFTDRTLKNHYTRKWDLQSAPSICPHCSLGCNTLVGARYGGVRRVLNRYHHHINGYFLCDRGRFAYEFANLPIRLRHPVLPRPAAAKDGAGRPPTAAEAIAAIRTRLRRSRGLIGIGSPRASLESNYALRRLVGPDRYFSGLPQGESRLIAVALDILRDSPARSPSLREIAEADAVLVLGEDLTQTAPRMALAVRQSILQAPAARVAALNFPGWMAHAFQNAVQDDRGPLFIASVDATRLDDAATAVLHAPPADLARFGFAVAHAIDPEAPPVPDLDPETADLANRAAEALLAADRPLVLSGTSLHHEALLGAAANCGWALCRRGRPAGLGLVVPEANTFGAGLLGGRPLREAYELVESHQADTAVILENDLYRRSHGTDVDRFFDRLETTIVLDAVQTATTARADILLPAAPASESQGTFISQEGRAQRFFPVLPPTDPVAESWRWLGHLHPDEARALRSQEAMLIAIAAEFPFLAGAREAAPSATFRLNGAAVPRSSRRFSGRTAIHAHLSVHEPKPPEDSEAPLTFSMEGTTTAPPAALVTHYWAPGWNSVQALNKFQDEVGGPNRGGDPGIRLIEPRNVPRAYHNAIPPAFNSREGLCTLVPLHHSFGSEELSRLAPAIAKRTPPAAFSLSPADARERGLGEGDTLSIRIYGRPVRLPVRIHPQLPRGCVGFPAGWPDLAGIHLPTEGHFE
ncbi:MAG: NADH-quinone oxidoreductase subunit NuoG [Puniceicoccaceae bacterium]|nr:MAG: NADH-quinone oxidoreductase subunit NuoG [Puniceicoccaceae bacterium]